CPAGGERRIRLGDGDAGGGNRRRVVAAVDRDLDGSRRAVGRSHRERVREGIPIVQIVEGAIRRIAPGAVRGDRERPVGAGNVGLGDERLRVIDVGNAQSPPVISGASISVNATAVAESTAASLLPLIVTCTVLVVPSAEATVKVSATDCPTFRLSKALFAT